MTIAVIIPHYNDVVRLERCLSGLMKNDLGDTEVVVVDNGSTQPLEELDKAFPAVRFVSESRKGAAAARNRGVRETTAPILAFLDADCIPAPDWLHVAREVAGIADLVGGRMEVFHETDPPQSGAEGFEAVFAFQNRVYVEQKGFSVTANLVTHRRVFEDVGEFLNGVSEDFDWCQRALKKGYSLNYADQLKVRHPSRSDWPALRKKWLRLTREMYLTNGTGARSRLSWALRGLAMPASVLGHLPRVLTSARLDDTGERLRTALTLARLRFLRMVWMLRQAIGLPIDE